MIEKKIKKIVRWRKDWDVPVVVDAKLYEILLEFLITKVDTAC